MIKAIDLIAMPVFYGIGWTLSYFVTISAMTIITGTPNEDHIIGATFVSYFMLVLYRASLYYVERGEKLSFVRKTWYFELSRHFKYALRDIILGMSIVSAFFLSLYPSESHELLLFMLNPTSFIVSCIASFVDYSCWFFMVSGKSLRKEFLRW